jgi:hypothetical protein
MSTQGTHIQLLDDIQKLQNLEQSLFSKLENERSNMSLDEQLKLIDKINSISDMRINLYTTLNSMNSYYKNASLTSHKVLKSQSEAVLIVERELNATKANLRNLESEKINKLRMIQINDYYGKMYAERTKFMKTLLIMLIPIAVLGAINNKGILPSKVYYGLVSAISLIGSWYLANIAISMFSRSSLNYDEYDWNFNPGTVDSLDDSDESSSENPWESKIIGGCYGEACCSSGQIYDSDARICKTTKSNEGFIPSVCSSKINK